jgi:hypothetical protein
MIVYQLYYTNPWGNNDSRVNLGVFSDPNTALYNAVTKHQDYTSNALTNDGRLFVEALVIDEVDSESQFYDSDNDETKSILFKIMLFELAKIWANDLGFRANVADDEGLEVADAMESWETYEDVEDRHIDYTLGEERSHDIIKTFFAEDLVESI